MNKRRKYALKSTPENFQNAILGVYVFARIAAAMSYDPKCYVLAEAFLEDVEREEGWKPSERDRNNLAQAIQDAIEHYLKRQLERPKHDDNPTLLAIQELMNSKQPTPDTLARIVEVMKLAGYTIHDKE